ncbi:acyl-CoA dehydrogenase [Caballeronia sp. 15711]|uniref:acyl-CoA dehydrogenase n=1 Tax=Caballeronia sp. 15711 TaxID=3391029 RepID=UPI0039E372BF
MKYTAPIDDIAFALRVHGQPSWSSVNNEIVGDDLEDGLAVLNSFGRFVSNVFGPLHVIGDAQGARRGEDGSVELPRGYADAYRQFVYGEWQGLRHDVSFGGSGLSHTLAAACGEMANGACISLALATLLTDSAIDAIVAIGSKEQQARWLPKLVAGTWCGTMNLTEPQAGSDLAALRCKAAPLVDGTYSIEGSKIFISYGDHEMSENILHLVLARLPDAPIGSAGLSLFALPKWRETATGRVRNAIFAESLERKLGLHGSPTAAMRFGGETGLAVGELLGVKHGGLDAMFVMMNSARFAVGVQAIGLADRAYQLALAYAHERVQSRKQGSADPTAVTIAQHPDVRRMLWTMRALVDGGRALYIYVGALKEWVAKARHEIISGELCPAQGLHDLLVPVVKGWCTEQVQLVSSLAIQVLGGHGYIEDNGVAQLYRDARILALYEGTTGIQANDLIFRKILRDRGAELIALLEQIWDTEAELLVMENSSLAAIRCHLVIASEALERAMRCLLELGDGDHQARIAGSAVEFLMLLGDVVVGWRLAIAAIYAVQEMRENIGGRGLHCDQAIRSAVFFSEHVLAKCPGRAAVIVTESALDGSPT